MHEVGHNWFYGIIGSNERKHPWMDEGINSFYENRYMKRKYPDAKLSKVMNVGLFNAKNTDAMYLSYLAYLYTARRNLDQPINLPSEEYSTINYGAIVYMKTAMEMNYLKEYLGETAFDSIMKKYYASWKFKHPQPKDIEKIFRENTTRNLDWFFTDVLTTKRKIDYKMVSLKKRDCPLNRTGDCFEVTVRNKGDIAAPFSISSIKDGKVVSTEWFEGFTDKKTMDVLFMDFDALKIDGIEVIPESNRKNNAIKYRGLFKKVEPLKLQLLWSLENPNRTQINYFPVVGWNYYNSFMPGIAVYSDPVFQTKFDYQFVPMYSFKTEEMTGLGNMGYTIFPEKTFMQNIRIGFSGSHFSYDQLSYPEFAYSDFTKFAPELFIEIKKKNPRSFLKQTIKFRNINIYKNYHVQAFTLESIESFSTTNYYNELAVNLANIRLLNPYNASIRIEQGEKFVKSSVETNYKFTYKKIKKGLEIRWFFGGFLYDKVDKTAFGKDYRFRLSGQTGYHDYLYDHYFLGRNVENASGNILGNQFTETEGGFKTYSYIGQTWKWLTALNLKTSLPGKIPFKIYADIGTYDGASTAFNGSQLIVYEAGIDLVLIRGIFDIYFPFLWSMDLKDNSNFISGTGYAEKIRFTLNINKLDPFKFIRTMDANKIN